jgi:hypothetical protein
LKQIQQLNKETIHKEKRVKARRREGVVKSFIHSFTASLPQQSEEFEQESYKGRMGNA